MPRLWGISLLGLIAIADASAAGASAKPAPPGFCARAAKAVKAHMHVLAHAGA